jgi:hypothetical protein
MLMLLGLVATAQIPVQLQIAATNGIVTVSSPTNASGLYFFGILQTTTDLSPPIVWDYNAYNLNVETSVSNSFPIADSQRFFRLLQHYPIFQFAIFYNLNMEIAPGQVMTINGPVFCNQSIWEGSEFTIFSNMVIAVGTNDTAASDPFATNFAPHNGSPPGNFALAGQPVSGTSPLNLLVVTNAQDILNLPPATFALGTAAAYSTSGQAYLANAVDLYITNSASGTNSGNASWMPKGTNTIIYFQDASAVPFLTPIANDFYIITNGNLHTIYSTNFVSPNILGPKTNIYYAGYSFVTNVVFYDYRESAKVQALQIDIAKFNMWLTNSATNGGNSSFNGSYDSTCVVHKRHPIDSIYVYNGTTFSTTQLPAVRVVNGTNLPSAYGFTIATAMPIYVKGNYNVTDSSGSATAVNSPSASYHSWPAALMADSITILSGNWSDSYINSTTLNSRTPTNTTVNAAILTGIVPSDPAISGDYSGGVENFTRLLENWSNGGGVSLYYNGSITIMFPSQYATNHWQPTGNYYTAPRRPWAFDTHFTEFNGLPPLTPQVVNFINP